MQITTYLEQALTPELSGNVIDLCPVGALTSRPYAFEARPWELKKTDSIDVLDAVGAEHPRRRRGPEVLRVLPRVNEDVNEEWMADRGRFSFDGLKRRRLDRPGCARRQAGRGDLAEAFAAIAAKLAALPGDRIAAVAGDLADAESMVALKDLMAAMVGRTWIAARMAPRSTRRGRLLPLQHDHRRHRGGDALLIIGSDVRREAPVINARIRKRWTHGSSRSAFVGPRGVDLTYPASTWVTGRLRWPPRRHARSRAEADDHSRPRGAAAPDGAAAPAAAWRGRADAAC